MRLLNKRLFIAVFLLIAVVYYFYGRGERAVDFNLNNWDGQTVTMDTLKEKVVILTFSYAFCSVRCPVITVRLSSLDDFIGSPQDVIYLHVGVDPEMDTPEGRKKYFSLYRIDAEKDRRWMFVSGDKDELLRLWRFYGIDIKKVESNWVPEGYYMDYTQKVVVIDKRGFIKYRTDVDFSESEIAEKIMDII